MLSSANSTTALAIPAGPYRPTAGLTGARVTRIELRGLDGLMLVAPGIELTNDPRSPGGATQS